MAAKPYTRHPKEDKDIPEEEGTAAEELDTVLRDSCLEDIEEGNLEEVHTAGEGNIEGDKASYTEVIGVNLEDTVLEDSLLKALKRSQILMSLRVIEDS